MHSLAICHKRIGYTSTFPETKQMSMWLDHVSKEECFKIWLF